MHAGIWWWQTRDDAVGRIWDMKTLLGCGVWRPVSVALCIPVSHRRLMSVQLLSEMTKTGTLWDRTQLCTLCFKNRSMFYSIGLHKKQQNIYRTLITFSRITFTNSPQEYWKHWRNHWKSPIPLIITHCRSFCYKFYCVSEMTCFVSSTETLVVLQSFRTTGSQDWHIRVIAYKC